MRVDTFLRRVEKFVGEEARHECARHATPSASVCDIWERLDAPLVIADLLELANYRMTSRQLRAPYRYQDRLVDYEKVEKRFPDLAKAVWEHRQQRGGRLYQQFYEALKNAKYWRVCETLYKRLAELDGQRVLLEKVKALPEMAPFVGWLTNCRFTSYSGIWDNACDRGKAVLLTVLGDDRLQAAIDLPDLLWDTLTAEVRAGQLTESDRETLFYEAVRQKEENVAAILSEWPFERVEKEVKTMGGDPLVSKVMGLPAMYSWHGWLMTRRDVEASLLWEMACYQGKGELLALFGDKRLDKAYSIVLSRDTAVNFKIMDYKEANHWTVSVDDPYILSLEQERVVYWRIYHKEAEAILNDWPWSRVEAEIKKL